MTHFAAWVVQSAFLNTFASNSQTQISTRWLTARIWSMNIFQREDSTFFFMRVFVKYTNPIINLFKFITPSFLFGPFIALYVAWFFYLFRFYAMPYILGYDVWGMLAFPLESDFSRQLYQLFN